MTSRWENKVTCAAHFLPDARGEREVGGSVVHPS